MKKALLFYACILLFAAAKAQSDKYTGAMQSRLMMMDTTRNVEVLKELSASFERIGDAEKNQWLPYYYSALAQVNSGYFLTQGKMGGMTDQLDPLADKAEKLLDKSEALSPDNSEIFLVRKMIASLRLMADPMNRYMQYGPQAKEALETAKKLNPGNPRIYLLEGQDKFFTPEQYGGSKEEAKKLFETALQKFDAFKPASELDPHWGRATTQYFLDQLK